VVFHLLYIVTTTLVITVGILYGCMVKHLKDWLTHVITIDNFVVKNFMQLLKSTSLSSYIRSKKIRSGKVKERDARIASLIIIVIICVQTSACVMFVYIMHIHSCWYLTKEGGLCVEDDLPVIPFNAVVVMAKEYYRLYVAMHAWCSIHASFLNYMHTSHRWTFASNFLKLGSFEYVCLQGHKIPIASQFQIIPLTVDIRST